jgi:hypothetical protein
MRHLATPLTRTFTIENLAPKWGQNKLDRDHEPFSEWEEEIGI